MAAKNRRLTREESEARTRSGLLRSASRPFVRNGFVATSLASDWGRRQETAAFDLSTATGDTPQERAANWSGAIAGLRPSTTRSGRRS